MTLRLSTKSERAKSNRYGKLPTTSSSRRPSPRSRCRSRHSRSRHSRSLQSRSGSLQICSRGSQRHSLESRHSLTPEVLRISDEGIEPVAVLGFS